MGATVSAHAEAVKKVQIAQLQPLAETPGYAEAASPRRDATHLTIRKGRPHAALERKRHGAKKPLGNQLFQIGHQLLHAGRIWVRF